MLVSGWIGIDLLKLLFDKEISKEDSVEVYKVMSIFDNFIMVSMEYFRWMLRLVVEYVVIGGFGLVSVGSL